MALPEDEPDWDCDVDTAVLPEVQAIAPINEVSQAPPAQGARMGVDIGCAVLDKVLACMLQHIRTPQGVARGLAAGAREWFEERVATCGQ